LALAAILLGLGAQAQAQTIPVSVNTDVQSADIGLAPPYQVILSGTYTAGTTLDVTWTITNTTGSAVILLPTSTAVNKITFTPATALTLVSENIPGANLVPPVLMPPIDPAVLGPVTVADGDFLTVTFQATVNTEVLVSALLGLSVGGVYDQDWNYDDFENICGSLVPGLKPEDVVVLNASTPQFSKNVGNGVTPDCAYMQNATISNDLDYPITVTFAGYSDSGTIAPYISGTLCDWDDCKTQWTDGITLQPGDSSDEFTMLIGMPWYIADEARSTTGEFEFSWDIAPAGAPPPTTKPTPIPALGHLALALLALGLAALGAQQARRYGVTSATRGK
jgi:hypothetical protein